MTPPTDAQLRAAIRQMLNEQLSGKGKNGPSRIAAARMLIDQMNDKKTAHETSNRERRMRASAIREAKKLLARLAAAQSAGADGKAELAARGKAQADKPAGKR